MRRANIPPVRLVRTGLTGAERWVESGCVTGCMAGRVETTPRPTPSSLATFDEDLGDGGGGERHKY